MTQSLTRRGAFRRPLLVVLIALVTVGAPAMGKSPDARPDLTARGRIVRVSSEPQLQAAVRDLGSNTSIVVAPGTYRLTSTLHIGNRALTNVALMGATSNRNDVVLIGPGMTNAQYASAPHGVWVGAGVDGVLIANLTIRDFYFHAVILNAGTRAPHLYNVRLMNAGEQLLKSNPDANGKGVDDGIVEYSIFEFENMSRDTYTNGVDVLGGARWIIRHNLFRNIRAPGGQLAGPTILMWRASRDTLVESNTFINCQREIALGLVTGTPNDHTGGIIRNNFIYRERWVTGDAAVNVIDSPGTIVAHNTILISGTYPNAIEYRFPDATGVSVVNNLVDAAITTRDSATATVAGNHTTARDTMFVAPTLGDLHLTPTAAMSLPRAAARMDAADDWDGQPRPPQTVVGADDAAAR